MRIIVLFYAEARDLLGKNKIELKSAEISLGKQSLLQLILSHTGNVLNETVIVKGGDDRLDLSAGYKLMINKSIIPDINVNSVKIKDGDIVGILPPFSGG
jgi:molybdopterin converting factor small subunit